MSVLQVLSDNQTIPLPFPASTAISRFDLLYWDTVNLCVQPLTHLTPGASEAADQATIGPLFVGVSADVRLSTETTAGIRTVITDGIFDVTCVSYTPALGDLIAVTRNGGSALVNQVVTHTGATKGTTAIGLVIGIPTQTANAQSWGSAATTVRVRITGALTYNVANHP